MKIFNITRVAAATSIAGALVVAAIAHSSGVNSNHQQPVAASVTDPSTLPVFEHVRVVNATPEQLAALARSANTSQYVAGQRAYVDAETKRLRPAFPEELAAEYRKLRARLGHLTVLGGCCGTDHRHIERICEQCLVGAY